MMGSITIAGARIAAPAASAAVVDRGDVLSRERASAAAFGGVTLLMLLAPFEWTQPLVRLPAQSISNLEAAVAATFLVWGAALVWGRCAPLWRTPLTVPWLTVVAGMAVAAIAAPVARLNAVHMAGRLAAAFAIYLLALNAAATQTRVRAAVAAAVATSVIVSTLVVLEYFRMPVVLEWLKAFRPFSTSVGALVRAGGPLQYPTIASMYLEVVFACGLGLMLATAGHSRRASAGALFAALLLMAYAITLTFTRAGLISMAASLLLVAAVRLRSRGFDSGVALIGVLAICVAGLFFLSRSAQSMWLRLTTEGQESWYQASIQAPGNLQFATGASMTIPLTLTNTGRLVWDSRDESPILLSYHWMLLDENRYVVFDGLRTSFAAPVAPGDTVTIRATVRAPRHPGRYRLAWDIVQEGRLWFSTEPDAQPAISHAIVDGPLVAEPLRTLPPPRPTVRPRRGVLWRAALRMIAAHPFLGVGPDNFRLTYAAYSGLRAGDPRIHSNNMYLEVLAGAGLLGGVTFGWLFYRAARVFAAGIAATSPGVDPVATGIAAAGLAIALHGFVDSFLAFAPTYVLFAMTLGLAAACARAAEADANAYRV